MAHKKQQYSKKTLLEKISDYNWTYTRLEIKNIPEDDNNNYHLFYIINLKWLVDRQFNIYNNHNKLEDDTIDYIHKQIPKLINSWFVEMEQIFGNANHAEKQKLVKNFTFVGFTMKTQCALNKYQFHIGDLITTLNTIKHRIDKYIELFSDNIYCDDLNKLITKMNGDINEFCHTVTPVQQNNYNLSGAHNNTVQSCYGNHYDGPYDIQMSGPYNMQMNGPPVQVYAYNGMCYYSYPTMKHMPPMQPMEHMPPMQPMEHMQPMPPIEYMHQVPPIKYMHQVPPMEHMHQVQSQYPFSEQPEIVLDDCNGGGEDDIDAIDSIV